MGPHISLRAARWTDKICFNISSKAVFNASSQNLMPRLLKPAPISLIVSMYQETEYLEFLMEAMACQTSLPAEIIISEDGQSSAVADAFTRVKRRLEGETKVLHSNQPDKGFRKASAMNRAALMATQKNLFFLDVDCFPHRKFFEEAALLLQQNCFLICRPVGLSESLYQELMRAKKPHVSFFELVMMNSSKKELGIYLPWRPTKLTKKRHLMGSAWGCPRSLFETVNGFEQRFDVGGYGFEDTDICNRMLRAGAIGKQAKNRLVYYHCGSGDTEGEAYELKMAGVNINSQLIRKNDEIGLIKAVEGLSETANHLGSANNSV